MSFTDLTVEEYTAKSVVVQGDTRKYKEDLKKLGGKYNGRLKNGPGWIFPKSSESDIQAFINKGKRLVTHAEEVAGEEMTLSRVTQRSKYQSRPESASEDFVTVLKNISEKVDFLENAILMLLNDDQKTALKSMIKHKNKQQCEYTRESEYEDVPRKRLMRK